LLVAQAQLDGLMLVTRDAEIQKYQVDVLVV
jgi:PIN domain nuclease of toxin-antitoxin system